MNRWEKAKKQFFNLGPNNGKISFFFLNESIFIGKLLVEILLSCNNKVLLRNAKKENGIISPVSASIHGRENSSNIKLNAMPKDCKAPSIYLISCKRGHLGLYIWSGRGEIKTCPNIYKTEDHDSTNEKQHALCPRIIHGDPKFGVWCDMLVHK